MNLVHLEFGRHVYGGAEQVLMLLEGLNAQGIQNHLVCPQDAAIVARARALGISVWPIHYRGELDGRVLLKLRRCFKQLGPDLVHLHSRRGADTWGALAARRHGVPVVLSRRVDNPEAAKWVPLKYRWYDRVVVISEAIGRVLREAGVPAEKIACVHSAIAADTTPADCDRASFCQRFAVPERARVIGMAAQFIERKGQRYLLEALPSIIAAIPDCHVILFGQGPERPAIEAAVAAKGLTERVHFPGFVETLPNWLPCLDVLVHPALREGLGVILLQAAAAGVPMVAARAGGIPEVVVDGENGRLVPPADAPALATACIDLLQDPKRAQALGEAGRRRLAQHFSPAVMVAGNLRIYQDLLAQRSQFPGRRAIF